MIRTLLLSSGAIAALAVASTVALAQQSGIQVLMNQAKIVKLARAADTIVVGNPSIADASVQDATTLVLTGKGFGVTNLVVMDADGNAIVDEQIYVSRNNPNSVQVYRRAAIQTLSCTPYCEGSYKSDAERASEMEMGAGQ